MVSSLQAKVSRLEAAAGGGREADFEKAWPKLRDEGRRRRVLDANRRAREVMRSSGVSAI